MKKKQAGAELCQAQDQLGIIKLQTWLKWGKGRGRGWGGCPEIILDVTKLYKVVRKVLDKSFQAAVMAD